MKRVHYILAVMLSLLIIYSGAGVSIMHYCCAKCETAQSCCTKGCAKCKKTHQEPHKNCKDKGCTATIYKVDLMKHTLAESISVPVVSLFCEQFPSLLTRSLRNEVVEVPYCIPPHPVSSRHWLALYSVLLI